MDKRRTFVVEFKEFESEVDMLAFMNDPNNEFNKSIDQYRKEVMVEASQGLSESDLELYTKWMDRRYTPEELERINADRGELHSAIMHSISAGFG